VSNIERTEGIVIRCRDITETSQLVYFYTRDFGKLKVIVKGSRGRTKRFKSKFDLFSINEILFYHNHKKELHTLKETEMIESFQGIRSSIDKVALASYMAELADRLTPVEDPVSDIYFLLKNGFTWLSETGGVLFLRIVFEIKLLHYSGLLQGPGAMSRGSQAVFRRVLQVGDISSLKNLRVSPQQVQEFKKIVGLIVDDLLGKRLKSLSFLEDVMKMAK